MQSYQERILATLGDEDPIEVLQMTPLRIEQLVQEFGSDDFASSYAPGKWSAREILAHLADVELAHALRFRQTLADDQPILQPFDQDAWAKRYGRADPSLAVACFAGVRSWNLALLTTLDLDGWLKEAYHPERGMMSMDLLVRTLAGHDLNHLRQLETIAGVR
ncbi:MAG TPA: DinB family protein [Trueperaceae bacterium]